MRVAVVTTHPIQYQVPWLRRLSAQPGIELKVFFAMIPDAAEQGREFGVAFAWDLPLLEGYDYSVLDNRAAHPSLTEFSGCDTPGIGAELRSGQFDAVIVNGWVAKTCLQALAACRLARIPCIVRGEANGLRKRQAWKHLGHRMLLRQYQAYLAIGSNNRQYYLARGVPAERICLTPYCVDNERFASSAAGWAEQGREALCRRFGLDPSRRTLLFSGKFVEKKRPGDIVEALRSLAEGERDEVQLLLVGDGPLRATLEQSARGLPVSFSGFLNQSEITAAYAVADCLVLPSDSGETWGLVTNEAMACGVPALVSDQVGCAIDLVSPGETGDVFGCGDTAGLAALIARHADRSDLERMGEAARRRVHLDYNFDRVVDGVMSALELVGKES
jgi:glycosyltransferase involved in cell wall biosynthesis